MWHGERLDGCRESRTPIFGQEAEDSRGVDAEPGSDVLRVVERGSQSDDSGQARLCDREKPGSDDFELGVEEVQVVEDEEVETLRPGIEGL